MLRRLTRRLGQLAGSVPVILAGIGVSLMGDGIGAWITAEANEMPDAGAWWQFLVGVVLLGGVLLLTDLIDRVRGLWRGGAVAPQFGDDMPRKRGLIAAVSDGDRPNVRHAIDHHRYALAGRKGTLTHCWLLELPSRKTQPISSAENIDTLQAELETVGITVRRWSISNALDAPQVYHATHDLLHSALTVLDAKELVVDVMGGTKMVTIGMTLAATEHGIDMEWQEGKQVDRTGRVEKQAGGIVRPIRFSETG